jgi:transposase
VHQDFYVVVVQEGGSNPKPPQRFSKAAFLHWAAKLKEKAGQVHAVYEACGFGFGLQRQLTAIGIKCQVVCPQKLDERNKRVKTDGLDAKALCLRLDRFVQGTRAALALVRVPSEKEEQLRAIHRQGGNCSATVNRFWRRCRKRSAPSPSNCKPGRDPINRAGWGH